MGSGNLLWLRRVPGPIVRFCRQPSLLFDDAIRRTTEKRLMKKWFAAIITGAVLTFSSTIAFAMSELAGITVTPLWPTNSFPGGLLLYEVRVERAGAGLLEVDLKAESLPAGCSATFSQGSVRLTGNDPRYAYFTMSIQSVSPTAVDCCGFSVTVGTQRENVTFNNAPSEARLRLGPVRSQLVNLQTRSSGGFELRGLGDTGQAYQIEASSSLTNPTWNAIGACTADGNGRFTFFDTSATQGSTARFYRAVKVVPQD